MLRHGRADNAQSSARNVPEADVEAIEAAAVHKEDAIGEHAVLSGGHHDLGVDAKGQAVAIRHVEVRAIGAFHHLQHLVQEHHRGGVLHALLDLGAQLGRTTRDLLLGQGGAGIETVGEEVRNLKEGGGRVYVYLCFMFVGDGVCRDGHLLQLTLAACWTLRWSESLVKMDALEKAQRFCLASTPWSMWPSATMISARSSPKEGCLLVATNVCIICKCEKNESHHFT